MRTGRRIIVAWAVMTVVGCVGEVSMSPGGASLHEGLNVIEARPDWGMNAAYVKNASVVYLQTRLGPAARQEVLQADAEAPQHEIDVRYVDQNGYTFAAQRAGDRFLDPSWTAQMAASPPGRPAGAAFTLAAEAALALAAAAPAGMAEHVASATSLAQVSADQSALASPQSRLSQLAQLPRDRAYSQFDAYAQTVAMYKKWVYVAGVIRVGQHASGVAWNYYCNALCDDATGSCQCVDGSGYNQVIVTCNHGTCGNSSNVSYYCSTWSPWSLYTTLYDYFNGEPSGSTGSVSGGCCTGYTPVGYLGGHNSNDDAAYEIWQIYNGTTGDCWQGLPNGFSCGGGGSDQYAPGCY